MTGTVVRSTGSWYQVRLMSGEVIDCRLRGKFKQEDKKITNPIAVGDQVQIAISTDKDYLIEGIEDRSNYVIRVSPKKKGHYHLLAANIDQAVVIASLKRPRTSLGFIDRFLVTLETFRIPGIIIINKSDLYDQVEIDALEETLSLYRSIGYKIVLTSFQDKGTDDVKSFFKTKTTLITGHSGTGKSTLINLLSPEAHQSISKISDFAKKGVHTTTFAEMFAINSDSFVIDTPGIKELGLAEIAEDELSHYFPEMRAFLGACKFHNCRHVNEPGCAIQEAVEEGKISMSRYSSYLSMLENYDNRR
ncbi:MAG: ribosome small subunit-dependent GTPase A [Cyclobacteriaceae bacterium]|nr:ribosome small subunit-dependent GTPase A [Cyclobacteriaceae bacterium HetDA_MAG_MS6]